ncbi:MAG: 2OG-Fe(II) oxygenase, partial [Rhodospirillaceae bacterium]|nr:2OG-Fe(II) oxygenase [Rhodospirillaceae bacterium]
IPSEFCADIIARFEADPRRFPGMVSGNQGAELIEQKRTTELMLVTDEWQDVVQALLKSLFEHFPRYQQAVKFMAGSEHKDLITESFRLKKYETGDGFDWHIDCSSKQTFRRVLAVQWYFNTVEEGGHTEFEDQGTSIAPVARGAWLSFRCPGCTAIAVPLWSAVRNTSAPILLRRPSPERSAA